MVEKQITAQAKEHGISEDEALARIKSQLPMQDKLDVADTVIDNAGSVAQTHEQVSHWLEQAASMLWPKRQDAQALWRAWLNAQDTSSQERS